MYNQFKQTTPKLFREEHITQVKPVEPIKKVETAAVNTSSSTASEQKDPMIEYYQLQRTLYMYTLGLMGIIFPAVWYFYSLKVALNYLIGAIVSVVYLRFLAKDVERIGQQQQRLGGKGLGIFVILMLIASKWQQLSILPVFLGFLTFKGAIIIYTLQSIFLLSQQSDIETAIINEEN